MAEAKVAEQRLTVKIFSPLKTYFYGQAQSLSAVNETGQFDILPMHHNFITLLSAGEISVKTLEGLVSTVAVSQSVLHAKDDDITIFVDV